MRLKEVVGHKKNDVKWVERTEYTYKFVFDCIFPANIPEVTKIIYSESFFELTYTWLFMKYYGAHSCGHFLET